MQFAVKVASKALKNVPSAEKLLRNQKQFTFRKLMRHFGKTRESEEGVTKTKKIHFDLHILPTMLIGTYVVFQKTVITYIQIGIKLLSLLV